MAQPGRKDRERRALSFIVIPDGGRESRTFRVTYRSLRIAGVAGLGLALLGALMLGSWWYLAARAARVQPLEEEVAVLRSDRARLANLAAELEELEVRYEQIRGLFGADTISLASDLWLPPPGSGRTRDTDEGGPTSALPTSWPLTERGFVTQPLLEGAAGDHPGIDIAVPSDSYIRAAGAGTVAEAGEDEVYGRFMVLDHGNGYQTRYAHASQLFVEEGQAVRRNEVIALSGSTGRSTAPHLHFEILLDGHAVDPMELLRRPS
jgi:murein DD-endopeptidase MepM/ murein hydrolase activator NlpD